MKTLYEGFSENAISFFCTGRQTAGACEKAVRNNNVMAFTYGKSIKRI